MLEISDLHAFYGKSHVLHGASLAVPGGEIVSLVGRNGAGRSTLAKAVMGLVECRGSIRHRGTEIIGRPPHVIARQGLALVPEGRDIFPDLTVRENLALGEKTSRGSARWSMGEFFEMFPNLKERSDVPGGALSGGEQQMLTICRGLMGDPDLIIIDEPTEGLAPKIVAQLSDLMLEIVRRGSTILLIEQKLTVATRISQRIYVMGHGRIVFGGTSAEFLADTEMHETWLAV